MEPFEDFRLVLAQGNFLRKSCETAVHQTLRLDHIHLLWGPGRPAAGCGVLNKQCERGSAVGSGGAALRAWQCEPQWGATV